MSQELLTKQQLAERLGVGQSMVRKLARQKRIPEVVLSERVRRFDLQAVLAALREGPPK